MFELGSKVELCGLSGHSINREIPRVTRVLFDYPEALLVVGDEANVTFRDVINAWNSPCLTIILMESVLRISI